MLTSRKHPEFYVHMVIFIFCLGPVLLSFLLHTDGQSVAIRFLSEEKGIGLPCLIRDVTGYNCPTCGMTRSFASISHLDLEKAWDIKKSGILVYLLLVFESFYRFLAMVKANLPYLNVLKRIERIIIVAVCGSVFFEFILQFFV